MHPLYFPLEARTLRTPFRAQALQTICDIAHRQLGDKLKSVEVFVGIDPYVEPERVALSINLMAELDSEEWLEADQAISQGVFEQETSWTEEERADFRHTIDFAVMPLKV